MCHDDWWNNKQKIKYPTKHLSNSNFWHSVMPLSRVSFGPLLSLSFSSNNDLKTKNQNTNGKWKYSNYKWNLRLTLFTRYFFKENFPNIYIKLFPTVWNIESFFQVHDYVRYLLVWVETVKNRFHHSLNRFIESDLHFFAVDETLAYVCDDGMWRTMQT